VARVLLILPSATYRAHDFTRAAADLGADLVVASDRRQAMSEFLGDRALVLPLKRPEDAAQRVVEHAAKLPLDAVVAVDDQGVRTAALAAQRLGLKTSDPTAVGRTRDKLAMREALAAAGVPQPDFRAAPPGDAIPDDIGYPVVVKPLGLSASRGVIRADDAQQAARVAERIGSAGSYSPATRPEIYYHDLRPGFYRLVITLAQNDGSTTPFHAVTNFQILPRPGHGPKCSGGKVPSAKAAARLK